MIAYKVFVQKKKKKSQTADQVSIYKYLVKQRTILYNIYYNYIINYTSIAASTGHCSAAMY